MHRYELESKYLVRNSGVHNSLISIQAVSLVDYIVTRRGTLLVVTRVTITVTVQNQQ